jgi:hypothetical protein
MYKILQWLGVYNADNNSEIKPTVDPVPSNDSTNENLNALGAFQKDLKNILGRLEQFKSHWTKLLNNIPNEAKRSPRVLTLEGESKLEKFFEAAKSFVGKIFETPNAFIEDDIVEYRTKIAAVREELKNLENASSSDDLKKACEKQAEHYLLHIKFCNLLIEFVSIIQSDLTMKEYEIDLIDVGLIGTLKFVILYTTGANFGDFIKLDSVKGFTDALISKNIESIAFETRSDFEEAERQFYMEKAKQAEVVSTISTKGLQGNSLLRDLPQAKKPKLAEPKEENKTPSLQMS